MDIEDQILTKPYISIILAINPTTQQQYQQSIRANLTYIDNSCTQRHWNSLCQVCLDSAENLRPSTHKNKPSNQTIELLWNKQKNIRLKMKESKAREKIRAFKK